jgi:DNA processing protein
MEDYSRCELHLGDPEYPVALTESPSPPETLYVAGDPAALRYGLGVVGARRSTPYGRACAGILAGWAASRDVVIISGAAYGCDQAAHEAALGAGGTTVAVLGCGADVDYPKGASALLARIRQTGAVVSEMPWGAQPTRWAFPLRNRIIAALSGALLVVEAGLPSGTFSTADHAADAGRTILAVPGSIFAPECRGSNRLLRQGATLIADVSDLALELQSCGVIFGTGPDAPSIARSSDDPLLLAITADPMRPDDAAHALSLDIVEAMRRLARLEEAGLAHRYPDGRYGPG